ncbi:MAG TPA: ribonuclease P protein component [Methylophilaceae bacterium]
MADHRFFSRYKLSKTDEFSSVFSFRRRVNGKYLAVHYMPNTVDYVRLGIVVSKKIARHAVSRNYIKRAIREVFRLNCQVPRSLDIVVRVNLQFGRHEFHAVEQEFIQAMGKIPDAMVQAQKVQAIQKKAVE